MNINVAQVNLSREIEPVSFCWRNSPEGDEKYAQPTCRGACVLAPRSLAWSCFELSFHVVGYPGPFQSGGTS